MPKGFLMRRPPLSALLPPILLPFLMANMGPCTECGEEQIPGDTFVRATLGTAMDPLEYDLGESCGALDSLAPGSILELLPPFVVERAGHCDHNRAAAVAAAPALDISLGEPTMPIGTFEDPLVFYEGEVELDSRNVAYVVEVSRTSDGESFEVYRWLDDHDSPIDRRCSDAWTATVEYVRVP